MQRMQAREKPADQCHLHGFFWHAFSKISNYLKVEMGRDLKNTWGEWKNATILFLDQASLIRSAGETQTFEILVRYALYYEKGCE